MKCVVVVCMAGALAQRCSPAAADPAPRPGPRSAARFAIVIGNNQPEHATAGVLRFADDDALATHRLLVEAGVHSVLLTRFDDTTGRLHPGAHPDGAPRWPALQAALARQSAEIQRARASGREAELLVFYSGHGDVERGEGYVLLEDRHLTRSDLADLLERSPATRNHVIIDACKSYYMAFEKGPGGHRVHFAGGFVEPARTARHLANTGFVLSTSSDRDSHEWERFGGGVFSHEVRSALRGAADLDRDGRISYAELGAFLTTASAAIANPRFRPDFLIRPAAGIAGNLSETLLGWETAVTSSVSLDGPVGHVYVETAAGERVLDAHPAAGAPVTVRMPQERPLFVRRDDGRELAIEAVGEVQVSELPDRPAAIAQRGAAYLAFEQLFASPFGEASVRRFIAEWTDRPRPELALAALDADEPRAAPRATAQTAAGVTALASGALGLVGGAAMLVRYESARSASQAERVRANQTLHRLGIATAIAGSLAVASGALWLALRATKASPGEVAAAGLSLLPAAGDAPGLTVTYAGAW